MEHQDRIQFFKQGSSVFYGTLKRQNTILHTEVPFIETQKETIARGRKSYLTLNEQKSIFPGAN